MMRPAAIVLVAGLAGCRALRTPGSGALVSGAPALRPRVEAIITEVEPRILAALGTCWPREFEVVIVSSFERYPGDTRDFDRRVRLGAGSLTSWKNLELTVAHELAHVHMTGDWRALPPVIQEGVADWISVVVNGYQPPVWNVALPEPELVRRVFVMDYDTFKGLPPDELYQVRYAAMYVASGMVRFGDLPPPKAPLDFRILPIDTSSNRGSR